jgi:aspartate aminotransferase
MFAARLQRIQSSPSMAAKAAVDRLRAEGRRIVDFTLGEPDLPTPPAIVEAAAAAMRSGQTRYTAAAGTPALRRAIAEKLDRDNHLHYEPDEIVVGCGGKHVIFHALAATLDPGDEVVAEAPFWVSYPDIALLCDAKPVTVMASANDGWRISPEAIEAAITPRTRWLVLNTPNNPSGRVLTRAELEAVAMILRRHPRVWLLSDEIYEHFVYDGAIHVSPVEVAPDLRERILIVNGVSKSYCMTGWRIGFGAGSRSLISAIAKISSQTTTCADAVAQAAAAAALSGDQSPLHAMVALFRERRDAMVTGLAGIDGLTCPSPSGAFYAFPSVVGLLGRKNPDGRIIASSGDLALDLLERAGVATVGGESYGSPGYLRLSFATDVAEIVEGCRRISAACAELTLP